MIDIVYFSGTGFLFWDWTVAFLAFMAGVSQFWLLSRPAQGRRCRLFHGMIGMGYLIWAVRFGIELSYGGDPNIAIPGLIGITMFTLGTALDAFLDHGRSNK